MPAQVLVPLVIVIPLTVSALLAAIGRWLPRRVTDSIATATAVVLVGLTVSLLIGARGRRLVVWFGGWRPSARTHESVGIVFVVDRIGAGIAVLVATLVLAGLVYSWHYFESVEALYHTLVLLFGAGMCGFVLSGDLFDMFVFFELMGAAAYALTGHQIEEPQTVQGALHFGVVNSLGAYFSLTGIALLYARTGELGLAQIRHQLTPGHVDALVVVGFVFVITGLLVKAAVVPFHFWTADAEAVAPSPICVLFSGAMVVLGVYGVARVYWVAFSGVLPSSGVRRALLVLGALTAVLGAVMCFAQHHLKRMLAYSTISHVGLFILGLATLSPDGLAGTALYVLGHAGAKGALFLAAGIVLNHFGTVDERALHGVGRALPVTGCLYGLGGLALAGLPPFGTFAGKSVAEDALRTAGQPWAIAVFMLSSVLTGGAVLRAALRVFAGLGDRPAEADRWSAERADKEEPETGRRLLRTPPAMLVPAVVLLAAAAAIGLVPGLVGAVARSASEFVDGQGYGAAALRGATGVSMGSEHLTEWTASGLALSLTSVALATALAVVASYRTRATVRAAAMLRVPMQTLRRIHVGHIGDSVAWMVAGVVVLAALVGL
ncbi:MAG: complex I subunit 5 family protein [Mycobacteriales bacterium]